MEAQTELKRWLLGGSPQSHTLPVLVYSLKKCKLLRIVHDHELLEQPLDDLTDRGGAADMQLLDGVERQVEGRPLVRGGRQVHFLDGVVDGLRPDPGRYRHRPPKFQMHFDETCVGAVFTLPVGGVTGGQGGSVLRGPICHSGHCPRAQGLQRPLLTGVPPRAAPTCLPEFLPASTDLGVLSGPHEGPQYPAPREATWGCCGFSSRGTQAACPKSATRQRLVFLGESPL